MTYMRIFSKALLICGLGITVASCSSVQAVLPISATAKAATEQALEHETELDHLRAIELAKDKVKLGLRELAGFYDDLTDQLLGIYGGPIEPYLINITEDWTVACSTEIECEVTAAMTLEAGSEVIDYMTDDFETLCPGGLATFTVLLDTATVIPTSDCATTLSK